MILTPYNLSIRNTVNGREIFLDGRDGFVVAPLRGMTAIPIQPHLTQGTGQVGQTVQGQSVQGYSITITGTILNMVGNRRKRMFDTILPETPLELIYRDRGNSETWILDTYVTLNPDIQHVTSFAKFGLTLFAPHPYWKSSRGALQTLSGLFGRFRFPVNYGEPHIFGERVKDISVIVDNPGNVAVNFVLIFVANATVINPVLHNVLTGEHIRINRMLQAGERVVIDMESTPMTVTSHFQGEINNIFGALSLDSTPFKLLPGRNILQDGADTGQEVLDTLVTYRVNYTGVW